MAVVDDTSSPTRGPGASITAGTASGRIAIIGMACRFPGANGPAEYWDNLAAGVDSIAFATDEQLRAAGVPAADIDDPDYVKAVSTIDDIAGFDAKLFGFTHREAEVCDPAHRLFIESCFTSLQDAGRDPARTAGRIGVFGGCNIDHYDRDHVWRHPEVIQSVGEKMVGISNQSDYLATRASYVLGLSGPSVSVATACSTSLVAVHLACQSLRQLDCDMALAGGVQVVLPDPCGVRWIEGGMSSRRGQVRPFDADADGTLFGTGVGTVLLKRLEDAVADGDHIHAVILGSAVNNDGNARTGFTAPGVAGQSALIGQALAASGVDPSTIGYVEAHGTGTRVGDPTEANALTQAYRAAGVTTRGGCPIGSVKGNFGHLGTAAGIAGLIKTVLAVRHGQVPPSLHFERPNPDADFADSPFYVNTELAPWRTQQGPRRAEVGAFGIGGTNAHVILEEAPTATVSGAGSGDGDGDGDGDGYELITVSAATPAALAASRAQLVEHVAAHPDVSLADLAHTLRVGRPELAHRSVLIANTVEGARAGLARRPEDGPIPSGKAARTRPVVFMFPGQGAQHVGMAREVYETDAAFRADVDACADVLTPHLGLDLRTVLFPDEDRTAEMDAALSETRLTQPALFTVEYALARLWRRWGIEPHAMVGHSVGEFVAACLAGVFRLEDALMLVAARGRMMQELPTGAMLAVSTTPNRVSPLLTVGLCVSAVNAPDSCVVSGPEPEILALQRQLADAGVSCQRLHTSHAFHSPMMEPIVEPFAALVRGVDRKRPTLPFVSTLTGTWIDADRAVDPEYWAEQLRSPVLFSAALRTLMDVRNAALLEVGPGQVLTSLVQAHAGAVPGIAETLAVPSLPHPRARQQARQVLLGAAGALWVAGAPVDLTALAEPRRRIPLPTYPFERTRYWLDRAPGSPLHAAVDTPAIGGPLYAPAWRQQRLDTGASAVAIGGRWLALVRPDEFGSALTDALRAAGADLVTVLPGERFEEVEPLRAYTLRPGERSDYDALRQALGPADGLPTSVIHAWTAGEYPDEPLAEANVQTVQDEGFYSLMFLAQALAKQHTGAQVRITAVSRHVENVSGADAVDPGRASLLGCSQVVNTELPQIRCRTVDVADGLPGRLAARILAEISHGPADARVALRGQVRWMWGHESLSLPAAADPPIVLRDGGVYLITGGLGGIGLSVARWLARTERARLVLTGRSPFPEPARWDEYLAEHADGDRVAEQIRQLRQLESYGAQVLVCQADVADEADMRRVQSLARDAFGTVNGVFHGAGVPGGGMLAVKSREEAARVLAPKVSGTLVLDRVFGEQLDVFVLFSSIESVIGGFGQADYGAANHFMDAFAQSRTGARTVTVAVNWCAWTEVGMAANAGGLAPEIFRELKAGARFEPSSHPMLDRRVYDGTGDIVFTTIVHPQSHWWLTEHQMGGQSVVPGTGYLEMVRAAFSEATGEVQVQLANVALLRPLAVLDRREIRITIGADQRFTVASRPAAAAGAAWTDHVTGQVSAAPPAQPVHDLAELRARCSAEPLAPLPLSGPKRLVDFGTRWASLVDLQTGVGEHLINLAMLPEHAGECEEYGLHPALFDNATANGAPMPWYLASKHEKGHALMPFVYDKVIYRAPLTSRCYSHVRYRGHEDGAKVRDVEIVDIVIVDEDGRELVAVEGFGLRLVVLGTVHHSLAASASPPEDQDTASAASDDGVTSEFAVSPAEGVDLLARILAARPGPQVIVYPGKLDLSLLRTRGVIEQLESRFAAGSALASAPLTARSTDTPYVAPQTDLERIVAGFWRDTLGIAEIGAADDFFEIGGNSLVAVQLVSRIRAVFQIDISIATVFEQPVLAQLAAAVDEAVLIKITSMTDQEAERVLAELGQ